VLVVRHSREVGLNLSKALLASPAIPRLARLLGLSVTRLSPARNTRLKIPPTPTETRHPVGSKSDAGSRSEQVSMAVSHGPHRGTHGKDKRTARVDRMV